jgi:hypothetical protein
MIGSADEGLSLQVISAKKPGRYLAGNLLTTFASILMLTA